MSTPDPPHSTTRGLSFRAKLVIGVCGLVLLTGAAVTWLAHRSALQSTEVLTDTVFREASAHAVDETRAFTERATPVVEALRRFGAEVDEELLAGDASQRAASGNANLDRSRRDEARLTANEVITERAVQVVPSSCCDLSFAEHRAVGLAVR